MLRKQVWNWRRGARTASSLLVQESWYGCERCIARCFDGDGSGDDVGRMWAEEGGVGGGPGQGQGDYYRGIMGF